MSKPVYISTHPLELLSIAAIEAASLIIGGYIEARESTAHSTQIIHLGTPFVGCAVSPRPEPAYP